MPNYIDRSSIIEQLNSNPTILTAESVRLSAMSELQRKALLSTVDTTDALMRLVDFQNRRDHAAATDWRERDCELDILNNIHTPWADAAQKKVLSGSILAPAQATVQLIREILECNSSGTRSIENEELVCLILSVSSEQDKLPESFGHIPDQAEFSTLYAQLNYLSREELLSAAHDYLHGESAAILFNSPKNLECLKSNALDFWYSPWPSKVPISLGETPAACFYQTTGFQIVDLFKAGQFVVDSLKREEYVINIVDLPWSKSLVDFIVSNMSLDLDAYRNSLTEDRDRGNVALQRYTFTRYPFLRLRDGKLFVLRSQWVVERFFGDLVQFDIMHIMNIGGSKNASKQFSQGITHKFEMSVGGTLERICANSPRINQILGEEELQKQWSHKKGNQPSVCDWVLRTGDVNILVEATHHPLNFLLSQALANGEKYNEDQESILNNRKYSQLLSTMRLIEKTGWGGTQQAEYSFIPLVIVPDSGYPSSLMSEMVRSIHAMPIFEEFKGRVARPAVVRHLDLQIIEGLVDHSRIDVVNLLRQWLTHPIPLPLQDYLSLINFPRPISNHILKSAQHLDSIIQQ
ncbi:hypothetical protein [Corynebacterium terpenotabidum]|uniref:hypothetical protein n=1 Tax=Corynebacterium terpenotabidum TaxID=89154 RepID=UPI0012EE36A5|nr:hypothetical protein [Corynebacterium terpenotabidum]